MMLDHYDFPIIDKYEVGTQGREQNKFRILSFMVNLVQVKEPLLINFY